MNALLRRTGHFPHFWLLRHYHSWGTGQLLLMTTLCYFMLVKAGTMLASLMQRQPGTETSPREQQNGSCISINKLSGVPGGKGCLVHTRACSTELMLSSFQKSCVIVTTQGKQIVAMGSHMLSNNLTSSSTFLPVFPYCWAEISSSQAGEVL